MCLSDCFIYTLYTWISILTLKLPTSESDIYICRDFDSYRTGEHSNISTCLIDNDSEYSPYSYE